MIRGQVEPREEPPITGVPRITITVANILDLTRTLMVEAVVDTGFTGYLALPLESIRKLGLPRLREGQARLANGVVEQFDAYGGLISWRGQSRRVPVFAVDDEPLLGMAMLWGLRLTIDAWAGGNVVITEVPP